MRSKYVFAFISILLVSNIILAQSPAIKLPLIVSDGTGSKKELYFGIDPAAADSLDKTLGEQELPPFPPAGIFEARFIGEDISLPKLGLGTYNDFRHGEANLDSTLIHELQYQVGSGSKIIIKWSLPKGIKGLLQDLFGGIIVNKSMAGMDSLIVDNPGALFKLRMFITYTGIPLAPKLVSPVNDSSNVYLNPGLFWHPSRTAESYRLQIASASHFSFLVLDKSGITDTAFGMSDLEKYTSYYWRVNATSVKGTSDWSEVWHFMTGVETSVLQFEKSAPVKFDLAQNYPNPFNPSTIIRFVLPQQAKVKLQVFDLLGREIAVLIDEEMQPGEHQVECKLNHSPNGVYIYRLSAGHFVQQRKMVLLK